MNKECLISIITINLNNAEGLDKTLSSIWLGQNVDPTLFENIVIDGNSSDNSVAVIDKYRDKLTYTVSESDSGIYNAMNKGIKAASGKYLLFLNSGDYLVEHVLSKAIFDKGEEDIIYCDSLFFNQSETWPVCHREKIDLTFFMIHSLSHPSTFIKRKLFDNEEYNEKFRIVSDWEFFVKKIVVDKCSIRYEPVFISYFDTSGISSSLADLSWAERKLALTDIVRENSTVFIEAYMQQHEQYKVLRYIFKTHLPDVLDSKRLQKKLRRWVKPLLWVVNK